VTGQDTGVPHGHGDVVLRTARLEMRPLTRAYLPHMLALYDDPRVTEFLAPLDEAGHLRRLTETEQMWASRGLGRVAVHERDGGRFLGRGGLHHWSQFDEVEVGWALRTDAQGHGYATEGARAWLDWGLAHLDVPYLTAYIAPDNGASRSVAARLGMSVLRTDTFHGREVLVYALHRDRASGAPDHRSEAAGAD
jgi:RimJ/RimL family protein N-acetyltransferase